MPTLRALVAGVGLGSSAKRRIYRKTATRWSGWWALLLLLDIIRFVRRRDRKVIARRRLRDGDVLVISSTTNRKRT